MKFIFVFLLYFTTLLLIVLGYRYGILQGMKIKKTNVVDVVDVNKIYLLPADDIVDEMDNDTLYLIFDKYVNQYQFHCSNILRQGPLDASGKNICADDPFKPSSPCIIYSFGSKYNFAFEVAIWKSFKCEIHTFDPSLPIKTWKIPSFVHYHLIGLSGRDFVQTEPEIWRQHDPLLKTWEMERLSTIQRSLSHTNKVIDILKIDIEGWEWDALPDIIQTGALNNVKQLCLEVHFGFSFKHVAKINGKLELIFTKNTWGNVSIKNQIKILKQLYNAGFRITMYKTFHRESLYVKDKRISALNELSLVNIELLHKKYPFR